jgi:hypothetical protein
MSALRLFSLPTHAVIELIAGLALMGAPFLLGFGAAGTVVAFALGVLLVGISLGGAEDLPVSTHIALDHALVIGFLVGSVALALVGDTAAGAVFLVAGLAQLVLTATTRYTRPLRPARF